MNIFKAILALVVFAGVSFADSYTIPKDNNNQYPGSINLVGVTSKYSTTVLSTSCITSVPACVYGMTLYTDLGAESTYYAVIYDTDSAKANSDFSSATYDPFRVSANLVFSSVTVVTTKVQRKVIVFDPPIICNTGVYVAFPGATKTTDLQWTIQYRNRMKGN